MGTSIEYVRNQYPYLAIVDTGTELILTHSLFHPLSTSPPLQPLSPPPDNHRM
ncbi:putative aspartic peptidase, active [Helianthus anomalus]